MHCFIASYNLTNVAFRNLNHILGTVEALSTRTRLWRVICHEADKRAIAACKEELRFVIESFQVGSTRLSRVAVCMTSTLKVGSHIAHAKDIRAVHVSLASDIHTVHEVTTKADEHVGIVHSQMCRVEVRAVLFLSWRNVTAY